MNEAKTEHVGFEGGIQTEDPHMRQMKADDWTGDDHAELV